jgi:hypothetical protein
VSATEDGWHLGFLYLAILFVAQARPTLDAGAQKYVFADPASTQGWFFRVDVEFKSNSS